MNRRHPSAGAQLPGDKPSSQPLDKPAPELTGALAAALARTLRPTQPPAPTAPPQPRAARRVPTIAWQAPKPRTAPTPRAEDTPAPPPRPRKAPKPRRPGVRVDGLQDLATITRQLREQRERAEAEEKARREAAARLEAERQLFSRAVGQVHPLTDRNLAELPTTPPEPLPLQHWLDEERVLMESISDDFDVSSLLDTDDQLSFRRPGIGVEITRRLRSGHWSIQRQLDLHGLRVDEAREALGEFIRHAHKLGVRCVRVVHGKGMGSPGKSPVLKGRVQSWLVQKREVLAFVQARPIDGGAGALLVLLQPARTA